MNKSHFDAGLQAGRAFLVASLLAASSLLSPSAQATDWPQGHSDVTPDPAIRFGTLPNGMRYAIMQNATPKGAVAMRLSIGAGSIEESDAQQGLAHFLEHMAFRGSRHVPEKEVWPGLQRLGMEVGADANAETGWTTTQYQFNLPRNDEKTVDAGLMRLREIASELTLDQRAMDDERGTILSEERLRDTGQFQATKELLNELLPGSLAARRSPIGLTDIIKHAPVTLIRDFYEAYYRPDNATVIVVGDVNPTVMESKIAAQFGDWKPARPAGGEPPAPVAGKRGPEADLFVGPGAPAMLFLNWTGRHKPDTKTNERRDLATLVGFQILSYRLQDIATGPQHPFADLSVGRDTLAHSVDLETVALTIGPQDWRIALNAAITAVRRLDQYGVTEDEVKRACDEVLANLEGAAGQAKTRPSPQVADQIAHSVDDDEVFNSPADQLALGTEFFKDMTAETVNEAVRSVMRDHGPLVLLSSPARVEGGREAVAAALAAAMKAPLTAATAQAKVVWPYLSFGKPGAVVERKQVADLDLTFLSFANGVRLTVKPTPYAQGQVAVEVTVGSGRLGLPPDKDTPRWAVHSGFFQTGTKQISFDDMRRVLASKLYQTQVIVGEKGLKLWGQTRPADLATQMQVFAAYVAEPGWRASGIDGARTATADELRKADASPGGVLGKEISMLLRNGDRRWAPPSLAEVAALKPQDLQNMLAPELAAGPIDVTVAGDVTVQATIEAVASTFGALPPRAQPAAPSREALALRFPPGRTEPVVLHHGGRADQGEAAIAWPTVDAFDAQTQADLDMLRSVIETRALEQLRIREGATYSPSAYLSASKVFPGFGFLLVATELPPAKMPLFFTVMASIVADLKAHPVSADELERARKPAVETILTDRQSNDYWTEVLVGVQTDPRLLDLIRKTVPDLMKVDAAAIQHVARTYLSDVTMWKAEIVPEPTTAPTPAPGQ